MDGKQFLEPLGTTEHSLGSTTWCNLCSNF